MPKTLPLAALLLSLAACQAKPQELLVERSWIRLPAVPGRPAAAYFTIKGGAEADRLLRVSSDVTTKTELHESKNHNGMMMMRPLSGVDIPPGGTVQFKPGGNHVMLYGLSATTKPGQVIRLTLTFADGDELIADTPVQAAGAPDPK